MSTILYSTKFARSPKEGLEWSVKLAKQYRAHLIVLYTYRLTGENDQETILQEKKMIEQRALDLFLDLEEEILKNSGVQYEFKTEIGFALNRIGHYLKKYPVKFLILERSEDIDKEMFEGISKFNIPIFFM